RRKNWQNWKRRRPNRRSPNLQPARRRQRNERAFSNRTGPRGGVFPNTQVYRFILAVGGRRCCLALALSDWCDHVPIAIQFFLVVRLHLFFHSLLRLFVLDDRASCHRRAMVGRSAPAAREYRAASLRSLYFC